MRRFIAAGVLALAAACGGQAAQVPGDGGAEAAPPVCDHDGCVVPLSAEEVGAVCGPSLSARRADCPGVTVIEGRCGILLHLEIRTAGPTSDCWYSNDGTTLVAAVLRSDSGFTKIAGTPPVEDCPVTSRACDHTPPS